MLARLLANCLCLCLLLTACTHFRPNEAMAERRISQYEDIDGVAYAARFRLMRLERPQDSRYTLFYSYEVRAASDYETAVLHLTEEIALYLAAYFPDSGQRRMHRNLLIQGGEGAVLPTPLPASFQWYLQQPGRLSPQQRQDCLRLAVYAASVYGFHPGIVKGDTLAERNIRVSFRHTQVKGWVSRLE